MRIKIAFGAGADGNLHRGHFGESEKFMIKELDLSTGVWHDSGAVDNTSKKERFHGDPGKSESIKQLLSDCSVLVGFAMGPNITRMRRHFIPLISRTTSISKVMENLSGRLKELDRALEMEEKPVIYVDMK